jgi:GTP-binding protein Era
MFKAGFIGLIGQPNAGKSTLMNLLVKERVSIVSSKPQTTRRRVLGIASADHGQIVFVDAPGVLTAQKGLNAFLTQEALDVIEQSDVIMAVLAVDTAKKEDIENFINEIKVNPPVLSKISDIKIEKKKQSIYSHFDIIESTNSKNKTTIISPDMAICKDCIADIFDETNFRFLYPLNNCPNCSRHD